MKRTVQYNTVVILFVTKNSSSSSLHWFLTCVDRTVSVSHVEIVLLFVLYSLFPFFLNVNKISTSTSRDNFDTDFYWSLLLRRGVLILYFRRRVSIIQRFCWQELNMLALFLMIKSKSDALLLLLLVWVTCCHCNQGSNLWIIHVNKNIDRRTTKQRRSVVTGEESWWGCCCSSILGMIAVGLLHLNSWFSSWDLRVLFSSSKKVGRWICLMREDTPTSSLKVHLQTMVLNARRKSREKRP